MTMKKILMKFLIGIIGTHSISTHSQELRKSLDDYIKKGSAWIDVRVKTCGYGVYGEYTPGDTYSVELNYITGDTLIEENIYQRVNTRTWESSCSYDWFDIKDLYFIQTDSSNCMWTRYRNEEENILLIDFSRNFEIGDTIRNRDGYLKHVISKVDTITFMDGSKGLIANNEYIYGIGHCYCSPVAPEEEGIEDGRSWVFLAFIRDGEFLYVNDHLKEILNNDGFVERAMKSFKKDADHILPSLLNNRTEADSLIYDLTGRKLDKVPKKGIYIQGGKKRAVKQRMAH